MAFSHCYKCGRALTNLISVKIGMGPLCRAIDNKQGEFDFMKAQFEVEKRESGEFIFIRDIGHSVGRSITNDAENVVNQLFLEEGITDETRIFYKDSDGNIDEILHNGKAFKGFKAGHEGVEL